MHISDLVGQYNNAGASSPITGKMGVERHTSSISELSKGNIFEGTVSSVKGGRVTLALSNGQQISARLDGKLSLQTGQSMFFQVKSNNGTTVEIRPYIVDGAGGNLTILQALKAAGLPFESDYITMVNKMMEEQMPIDRSNISVMAKAVSDNSSINVNTLVQMQKLGIKLTPEMASQFENYMQDKQAIGSAIDDFIQELGAALTNDNLSEQELRQTASQVLDIISATDLEAEEALAKEMTALQQEGGQVLEGTEAEVVSNARAEEAQATNTEAAEQAQVGDELSAEAQPEELADRPQIINPDSPGAALYEQLIELFPEAKERLDEAMLISVEPQQQENEEASEVGTPMSEVKELSSKEALDLINNLLKDRGTVSKELLVKFLGGKEFNNILKNSLEEQWLVKPKDVQGSDQINKLYEHMEKQISRMESAIRATGQESPTLTALASEIRNNVEFMNQINEAYTYVQIPLKMSGQNASGELYVFTNKKNLRDPEGELTAFLHLDMDHLGSTDVSIKMRNKEVSTNFYMDNDQSYALIKQFLPELEQKLKDKGYKCNLSVVNEEKQVNFVENFLKKDQPSVGKLHRYSFDMRA